MGDAREGEDERSGQAWWLLVLAAVSWNLVTLRAETRAVAYLNDSSVHEQMVRFATAQFRAGHLPLRSWFPYLGLGSPQFLHYQSLPAMLTGLAGLAVGPNAAFRWSLYLLLSAWPVSVYAGGRAFGLGRPAAAAAAALSPFLVSVPGVGYEQHAYLWLGYGVWTQLWASMTLPLAWGLSWRAIRDGRGFLAAGSAVALTTALHFETGYLALLPLVFWPLISRARIARRARRALLIGAGSLGGAAWVIVPLLDQRPWAATNEVLHGTPLADGYGAGRVMSWLLTGRVLDSGRLPVVTALAAVGLVTACRRWRHDENARALVVVVVLSLVLSFGRATLGSLTVLLPGSSDIFFRRFMMGLQLALLLTAGVGAQRLATILWARIAPWASRWHQRRRGLVSGRVLASGCIAVVAIVLTIPLWTELLSLDRADAEAITRQQAAERVQGSAVDALLAVARAAGAGRVYAGTPANWGSRFRVGAVPVFKFVESRDVDEIGYTLRTASLMTPSEYYFDERTPGDYRLFGVRYLLLPAGRSSPVRARRLSCREGYCVWQLPGVNYVGLGLIASSMGANRSDVGARSVALLRSAAAGTGALVGLDLGGREEPPPRPTPLAAPGLMTAQDVALTAGRVTTSLDMHRPGVVVLSASFDPGWTIRVDGRPAQPVAVAPALVGASVPAGRHAVTFAFVGFSSYSLVFVASLLSLAALGICDVQRARRRRRR